MRRLIFVLVVGVMCASLAAPSITHSTTDSGIYFGPYVQRVGEEAATILIRTNESQKLKLNYRKVGASDWKTKTDSSANTTHRWRVTGLSAAQDYEYYVATKGGDRLTLTYTFSTKRDITNEDPLRVAVVGDYGAFTTDELRVVTQIQWWQPDLMLTTGDNAYNSGTLDEFVVNVLKPYQPVWAEVPVYPSIGNHDMVTDSAAPYKSIFETPKNSGNEDYYSFDYDSVHFVALNTDLAYTEGSDQYTWLVNDLAASDEAWKIVYFHYPVYSSGEHGTTAGLADALRPVFEQYHVDLALNGHDHDYERNQEMNGVLYIVTGGGGNLLYSEETANPYSELFQSEFHFVGLVITDDELKIKAIDKRGYLFDEVKLKQ